MKEQRLKMFESCAEEDIFPRSILKGCDDGVMHFEESCFRTLFIVQYFSLKATFRKLALLPSSGKGGGGMGGGDHIYWGYLMKKKCKGTD
jgi:hypothetical protein